MLERFPVFLFLLSLCATSPGCNKKSGGTSSDGTPRLTIAVVPKGTTHEFWKSVHAGAVKAARELDIDVVWKGPLREDDLKEQIDVVQSFVAQGVGGIVLAPLSDKGLVGSVKAATDAHVPVVVFDSDLAGANYASFVATDNEVAGKTAGDALAAKVGKGNVVLLRYQEGSASTANREKGFVSSIHAHPDLKLASDERLSHASAGGLVAHVEGGFDLVASRAIRLVADVLDNLRPHAGGGAFEAAGGGFRRVAAFHKAGRLRVG